MGERDLPFTSLERENDLHHILGERKRPSIHIMGERERPSIHIMGENDLPFTSWERTIYCTTASLEDHEPALNTSSRHADIYAVAFSFPFSE
jgi:hypothetical protein